MDIGDGSVSLEGMPFMHIAAQRNDDMRLGWPDWIADFGYRTEGADRGMTYPNERLALEAVRKGVGFLICGLSLVEKDLAEGSVVHPFPTNKSLLAPLPYVLSVTAHGSTRPQLQRFCDWLSNQAHLTRKSLEMAAAYADG